MKPAYVELAMLSRQYVLSRSIHALARLSVADYMSDEPISVEELAKRSATIPDFLERILNFLSDYGLFSKSEQGFALTDLSGPLRSDHPFSIKDILSMVDESWWQAFAHLETTLKTGEAGFQIAQNRDFFDYLKNNPEKKANFQRGLLQLSQYDNQDLLEAYPFESLKQLVILGGNNAALAESLMKKYPHLNVASLDIMTQADCKLPDSEAILIKGILHDLSEEQIGKIVTDCHHAITKNGLLLIAEQILPDDALPHTNKTMDIIMMMLVGGRQRSLLSWREIIEGIGFKFGKCYQTKGVYSVMEFERKSGQ